MEKNTAILLLILTLAFLIRVPAINDEIPIGWDSSVYVLNAKFFAGNEIYFEDLRPPLLPFMLTPFSESREMMLFFNMVLSVASILAAYLLIKEISSERTALLTSALLAANALFLQWTARIGIESGSILFSCLVLYFFIKAKKDPRYFYGVGTASALAFLFRYNLGLAGALGGIWFLASLESKEEFKKLVTQKHLWGGVLLMIALTSIWFAFNQQMFGNPLWSVQEGFRVFSNDFALFQPGDYYIKNFFLLIDPLTAVFFFVGLLSLKNLQGKKRLLLIWLMVIVIFFQFQGVKEMRYLIPVLPVMLFFSVEGIERVLERVKLKKHDFIVVLVLMIIQLSFIVYFYQFAIDPPYCEKSYGVKEAGLYMKDLPEGTMIYTNSWPMIAFYSEHYIKGIFVTTEETRVMGDLKRVDYVVFTKPWIEYPIKKEFLDSLEELEYIGEWGTCHKTWVYRVKEEYKEKQECERPWDMHF